MLEPDSPFHLSPRDRDFLSAVVLQIGRHGKKDLLNELLQLEEEAALSGGVERSRIQDAALLRGRRRAVLLANWIIDDEGTFLLDRLRLGAEAVKKHIFYVNGPSDRLIQEHLVSTLDRFVHTPALVKSLAKFSRPLCHSYAERLVRLSLFLPLNQPITNAHVRRAVFSACLTYLRQSIGSCFATAPALLIQTEQIEYLLKDLYEMLSTGRLKRTLEGVEYSVPLSPSFGMGDLRRDMGYLHDKPVATSPGLIAACQAANLFKEEWPLKKKEEELHEWLKRTPRRGDFTVIDFFEVMILNIHGVSKEEWDSFNYRRTMPQHRLAIQGTASPRDILCEKILLALRSFKETFVAFNDHPLLKTWEFTLASFSESKTDFSRWNLHASLGLDSKEEGGIGAVVMQAIEEKLGDSNAKVAQLHQSYEIAFDEVRATEALLRQADNHEKIRRLQAEYSSRMHHMNSLLEMRNAAHNKGERYANLLNFLVKQYDIHFPQFFQEIYDAEMFDPTIGPFQDSMAGFRLVYKHGRNDPSQWTMIHDAHQYIDSLIDFFKMTETSIISSYPHPEAAQEISRITDLIIIHVRSPSFLDTAMLRMKKAHSPEKLPGHSPDLLIGEKKPWAYISGGTMENLIKYYYRYPGKITEESRWAESAEDLLVFFLDSLKGISLKNAEHFEKKRKARMLAHSPNHAFSLFPGYPGFFAGWQSDTFTYTWVREMVLNPGRAFYESQLLSQEEQLFLLEEWSKRYPPLIQHQLAKAFGQRRETCGVKEFVESLHQVSQDIVKEEEFFAELDLFLYQMLPLCAGEGWKERVLLVIPEATRELVSRLMEQHPDDLYRFLGSFHVQELAKAFLLLANDSLVTPTDFHATCAEEARLKRAVPPAPIIFGDTNWPHFFFAFLWGPASQRLRLCRMDANGLQGVVMTEWEIFFGKIRLPWGCYTRLEQYM